MIIAYSTGKNKFSSILDKLGNIDGRFTVTPGNVDNFLSKICTDHPNFILGFGDYSGKDQQKIRIETKCTNKFRNTSIDSPRLLSYSFTNFIVGDKNFKSANGIGNSYCNLIAYRICNVIVNEKLNTKFSFLHIPKSMKVEHVTKLINDKLT